MLVTAAPGIDDSSEPGLERFDDEPGPVVGGDVLGQCGSLRNQHFFSSLLHGTRYLMPRPEPPSGRLGSPYFE